MNLSSPAWKYILGGEYSQVVVIDWPEVAEEVARRFPFAYTFVFGRGWKELRKTSETNIYAQKRCSADWLIRYLESDALILGNVGELLTESVIDRLRSATLVVNKPIPYHHVSDSGDLVACIPYSERIAPCRFLQ